MRTDAVSGTEYDSSLQFIRKPVEAQGHPSRSRQLRAFPWWPHTHGISLKGKPGISQRFQHGGRRDHFLCVPTRRSGRSSTRRGCSAAFVKANRRGEQPGISRHALCFTTDYGLRVTFRRGARALRGGPHAPRLQLSGSKWQAP